jgi:hypothetical protein
MKMRLRMSQGGACHLKSQNKKILFMISMVIYHTSGRALFQKGEGNAAIQSGGGLPVGVGAVSLGWLCDHSKYNNHIPM